MRNAVWVLLGAIALAGCVAHEKQGDSAAAVGNWREAYQEYQVALQEKPDTPGLKDKYDNARKQAAAQVWVKAQGCEATQDWACAKDTAEFTLSLDPMHQGAIALRARANTELSLAGVNDAGNLGRSGKYEEAISRLLKSRQDSNDPVVVQRFEQVKAEITANGSAEAERRRNARDYVESAKLYELLAQLDAKYREVAQAVAVERDAYLARLYEDQAAQGDKALATGDFRAANGLYAQAEKIKPNGRAEPLVRYTSALISADDAITRKDWSSAEIALRAAVSTGADKGMASDMLERVRVRPYRVALRSLLIPPARLDGNAWVGNTSVVFFRVAQQLNTALGKSNMDAAMQLAMLLPTENTPTTHIEVMLPDGQQLASEPHPGIYALQNGEFIISGNAFDDRRLAFKVVQDSNKEEIGRIEVSYRDLFTHAEMNLSSQTIADLKVGTDKADGRTAGTFVGMNQLAAGAPTAVATGGANVTGTTTAPAGGTVAPAGGTTSGNVAPANTTTTGTVTNAGGTTHTTTTTPTTTVQSRGGKKGVK